MNKLFIFLLSLSFSFADEPKPEPVATWQETACLHKQLETPSQPIPYTVHVGTLQLPGKVDDQTISLSYIAYIADSTAVRPITFCFNGGPGSSSIWLHMGFLGPKQVVFPSPITAQNYQPVLQDNPNSLLSTSDLVFIDPVSTGFSIASKKCDTKDLFGVEEDTAFFAQFIERFLTKYQKWSAPKYLLGESYGTLRAVLLAKKLHDTYYFDVDGLILLSEVLDLQTLESDPFEEISLISSFPSIVLLAQMENLLPETLATLPPKELYLQAKQFAVGELLPALFQDNLPQERLQDLAKECSIWTGLPATLIEKTRLRFTLNDFRAMIREKKGQLLGRFDSRIHLDCPYQGATSTDPSFSLITNGFTSAINRYFTEDLQLNGPRPYAVLNPTALQTWHWHDLCFPNYTSELQTLLLDIPSLRVYIATGLYDTATPPAAQELVLARIALNDKERRIHQTLFEGGHMMYLDRAISENLSSEVRAFIHAF